MGGRILAVLLVAGCGRFGFGDSVPGDGNAVPGDGEVVTVDVAVDGTPRAYMFQDGFEGTLAPWSPLGNVALASGAPVAIEGSTTLRAQANTAASGRAEVTLPSVLTSSEL